MEKNKAFALLGAGVFLPLAGHNISKSLVFGGQAPSQHGGHNGKGKVSTRGLAFLSNRAPRVQLDVFVGMVFKCFGVFGWPCAPMPN